MSKYCNVLFMSMLIILGGVYSSCENEKLPFLSITTDAEEYYIKPKEAIKITFNVEGVRNKDIVAVSYKLTEGAVINYTTEKTVQGETGLSGIINVNCPEYIQVEKAEYIFSITAEDVENNRIVSKDVKILLSKDILAAGEPSNCYIVPSGSSFKFAPTKGNSIINPEFDGVKLLWQDTQSLVHSVYMDEPGFVCVDLTAELTGNAVVAVTKNNEIQWSYHLWITDYQPDEKVMKWMNAESGITYEYMDRCVGALSAQEGDESSNGLFYQFGRKDPFPASNYQNEIKPAYTIDNQEVEFECQPCTEADNISMSILNPTIHYSGVNSGNWSWITTDKTKIVSDFVDIWGGKTGKKSMYDPCPEGWIVMPVQSLGFLKDTNVKIEIIYKNNEKENKNAMGRRISIDGTNSFWFPLAGEKQHTGDFVNGVGSNWPNGKMWSGTVEEANFRAYAMSALPTFIYIQGMGIGYGLPVRCVKQLK